MWFFGLLLSFSVQAQVVVRPVFEKKIELKIVRADPDSFETYALMNHNGREMSLVCAKNPAYDSNPQAMIRYRNFFGEEVGDFTIGNNEVCKDMAKFIESASAGINSDRPFLITLDTAKQVVEKIVYPAVDPFLDEGDIKDLLPKDRVYINSASKASLPKKPRSVM